MTVNLIVTLLAYRHEILEVVPATLTQRNLVMGVKRRAVGAGVWSASTTAMLTRVLVSLVNSPPPCIPIRRVLSFVGVWIVPLSVDTRTPSESHFDTADNAVFGNKPRV